MLEMDGLGVKPGVEDLKFPNVRLLRGSNASLPLTFLQQGHEVFISFYYRWMTGIGPVTASMIMDQAGKFKIISWS
jgi:hypothetical protein